jgi:uncharacterized C2H2 Zn-finger protein
MNAKIRNDAALVESENAQFKCVKCDRIFETESELQVHIEKHHAQIVYVHHK